MLAEHPGLLTEPGQEALRRMAAADPDNARFWGGLAEMFERLNAVTSAGAAPAPEGGWPDASHQRRVEESCAECGVAVAAEIWDVADLAARPELTAGLRDGSHWAAVCANGHAHRFDTPVLILRDETPRVLFVPGVQTSEEEDAAAFEAAVSSVPPERLAALAQGSTIRLRRCGGCFCRCGWRSAAEIRALAPAVAALTAARDPQSVAGGAGRASRAADGARPRGAAADGGGGSGQCAVLERAGGVV